MAQMQQILVKSSSIRTSSCCLAPATCHGRPVRAHGVKGTAARAPGVQAVHRWRGSINISRATTLQDAATPASNPSPNPGRTATLNPAGTARAVVFQSPKYFQQSGALHNLGSFVKDTLPSAARAGIISAPWLLSAYGDRIYNSLHQVGHSYRVAECDGECSRSNLDRIMRQLTAGRVASNASEPDARGVTSGPDDVTAPVDYVIAFGGGKTLDMGKLVGDALGLPVVVVPSLAASDAPCTALSVLYSDVGEFEEYVFFRRSPAMVVVDSQVIAEAPPHTLASGMGDAMATYYEARACALNPAATSIVRPCTYRPPLVALPIARACLDILFAHGPQALQDCTQKTVSQALEQVIEANILMSGLGAECGGLAIAHGFHNALTALPETHAMMHGQKVALGTVVQLLAEQDPDEANKVAAFNKQVGLPTCFDDLGVKLDDAKLELLVAGCMEADSTCWNLGPQLTPDLMKSAILQAEALGHSL